MEGFRADPDLALQMGQFAEAAVEVTKLKIGWDLDWSIESIRKVEDLLGEFHKASAYEQPSEEEIDYFSMTLGSYLGEVIRRHHGGEWGWLADGSREWPGLSLGIWPQIRAKKRILNGPEENIWHYYVMLFEKPEPLKINE